MAETFNTPIPNDGIYKYQGHTTYNGGGINGTPHVIRPKVMNTGVGIETIEDLEGKYNINVHDIAVMRNREEFTVKFIADLNTKSINKTVHLYGEDWDGQYAYPDMLLNQLRQRNTTRLAINNANNKGGRWMWKAVHSTAMTAFSNAHASGTINLATGVNSVTAATRKEYYALADYNNAKVLPLAFELNTGEYCLGGSASDVIFKMIGLLRGNDYLMAGGDGSAVRIKDTETEWYAFLHNQNTKTVHFMFPDLAINIDGVPYQEHEVVVQLEAFWYSPNMDQFVVMLNFDKSNLRSTLGSTNVINLEEMVPTANTYFEVGDYTRLDHQALVGYFDAEPEAIAEGSGARLDSHTIWQNGIELRQNFVQIFRSKPLEITGTRLATGDYRVDDIQRNRDKMFRQYNTEKNNAMLWGVQSQTLDPKTGRPVRFMSGIFDHTLNPIRYMRTALNISSASNYSEVIEDWLNNIAYSYAAFMEKKGNRVITLACSHDILRALSKVVKLSYGQQPNLYGTQPAMANANPSNVDFSVRSYDFISSYGITLRFVHAPEFDMMTSFKLPYTMVGTGVKPRNIIVALDKEYISSCVLKPDTLQGNIQGADEDLTREDIIGYSTVELLYPKNHAVIIVDVL